MICKLHPNPPVGTRARYTMQCIHPESGQTGDWLFTGDDHHVPGTSLSPLFPDILRFHQWKEQAGWTHAGALHAVRDRDTTVAEAFRDGSAVVIGGHTLGIKYSTHVSVMRALPRLGAPDVRNFGEIAVPVWFSEIRQATIHDFETFRVMWSADWAD